MPPPGYYRKRREKLMRRDPHCHWCQRQLVLYPDYGKNGFKSMPEDYPTIDHLISAFLGPRNDVRMKMQTLVLACPRCNNARNVAETQKYIWRTRWKSASFPFPLRWLGKTLKKSRWRRRSMMTIVTPIHPDSAPSQRGPG
jgi:5-methylcytosine-specific restriction endonuclease McrA